MTSFPKRSLPFILAAALVTSGCAMAFDASTLGVRASVSEPGGNVDGAQFRISKKSVFLLFGIIRASQPSLEDVLAGQLVDGTEVANLRIKVRSGPGDLIISFLTAGLVVPRSVTYEGVVVGGGQ